MAARSNAPVFVVGSPRSGTTLFYHMLLSTGKFAVYRTEAHVFNLLVPAFGDLVRRENREALLREWLPSEYFRRSGLREEELAPRILDDCRSGGDFLRILMEEIARAQGVPRWAECTPENLLYMREIKRTIPDALFIHMVRDGRDVALSLGRQGWLRPFPWDAQRRTLVAGLFWEWLVAHGRENSCAFSADYMEVHYEELVERPQETLSQVGRFIDQPLNYEQILQAGVGSVSEPNTSFQADVKEGKFRPVGRWKKGFTVEQLAEFEALLGPALLKMGYTPETPAENRSASAALRLDRVLYGALFSFKHWLKTATPLGRRFVDTTMLRDFHAFDQERLMPER